MSTPLSPWSVKILEILADGQSHTVDELVRVAGPVVPPGRASRFADGHRAHQRRQRNSAGQPARELDPVDVGRRALIVAAINSLARHGRVTRTAGACQLTRTP